MRRCLTCKEPIALCKCPDEDKDYANSYDYGPNQEVELFPNDDRSKVYNIENGKLVPRKYDQETGTYYDQRN